MIPLHHDQVRGKASLTKLEQLNEIGFTGNMLPCLRVSANVTEYAQGSRMLPDKVDHHLSLFEGREEYGAAPLKFSFDTRHSNRTLVATYIL